VLLVVVHVFYCMVLLQISFKTSRGTFSPGLTGRAPMRQPDCCGELSAVRLCPLTCRLFLDPSSRGRQWVGFC